MKKFSEMLQEGLLSDKEEILLTMYESIGTMMVELNSLKRKIDYYMENIDELPINHKLDLDEEFIDALGVYQNSIKQL